MPARPGALGCPKVILEPGRSIVADAGMTIYRAGAVKEVKDHKPIAIVDGGMTDNIRYALYGAIYTVYRCRADGRARRFLLHNHRPLLCESGDMVAEGVALPRVRSGDFIAVAVTGAYNYCHGHELQPVPPLACGDAQGRRGPIGRSAGEP